MKDQTSAWTKVGQFSSGIEAEIGRAVLEAGGFEARVMGNDSVGIFGPNFIGSSSRGAFVIVPGPQAAAAERYLAQRKESLAQDASFESELAQDASFDSTRQAFDDASADDTDDGGR